ncbi:MAG TPA: YciI family protein [Bryobacteraceae bacterium]|nr:YciI family protein [Bryobacteraceae bacterium]
MKVMVLVKATQASETGVMPTAQLLEDMGRFNEELTTAGVMKDLGGLKPTSQGARVTFSGKDRTVRRGPFENTSELAAGYWLWEVESLDEAIEWVKRCPNPMPGVSDIEIRPLYSMEDLLAEANKG